MDSGHVFIVADVKKIVLSLVSAMTYACIRLYRQFSMGYTIWLGTITLG